ncbi:MAG: helix-turn-helix domain-containing protein [Eubacterium sp.]|nr:helix-turn-helix domain-containing protein [Eubacterium sp.]
MVALYQSGKSQSKISKDYEVSISAVSRWIKLYSEVKIDDDTILSAKQIKELQKRNAQLENDALPKLSSLRLGVFENLYMLFCNLSRRDSVKLSFIDVTYIKANANIKIKLKEQ